MSNGTNGKAPNKELQTLLDNEIAARTAWYEAAPNGKATSKEQGQALRVLEKAKAEFTKGVGGTNFRDACSKMGYTPQYAVRAPKAAKVAAKEPEAVPA